MQKNLEKPLKHIPSILPWTITPCPSKKQDATASSHIQHLSFQEFAKVKNAHSSSFPWGPGNFVFEAVAVPPAEGHNFGCLVTWKLHIALVRTWWKWINTKFLHTYSILQLNFGTCKVWGQDVMALKYAPVRCSSCKCNSTRSCRGIGNVALFINLSDARLSCRMARESPRLLYNGGVLFPYQVCKRCKKWEKTHLASSMSIWWYRKAYSQK